MTRAQKRQYSKIGYTFVILILTVVLILPFLWMVSTSFKEASLSKISSNLRESIILWLDEHNDEQRRKMIETVFEAFEKSGIKDTNDFFNIKKSFNIVKNIRNVDDETKELVMSLIQFNINYLIENS